MIRKRLRKRMRQMLLIVCTYDLLKEARTRIKDVDSVEYAFADINCSLGLRLKNGRFRFFNSSEELNMALAEV